MLDQFVDDLAWYMLADRPTDRPKRDYSIEFRGKTYKNIKACCKALGFSDGVINYRIRTYSESFQEAMEYYLNGGGRDCSVEFRGKTYKSMDVCCEALGFSHGVINYRIRTYNESFQEAMEYYLNGGGRDCSVEFRGKTYKSMTVCCKTFDVPTSTVRNRMKNKNEKLEESLEHYLKLESK